MSALSVEVPFPVFYDRAGEPLENGYVFIGQANLNPQTNPIQVFFDRNLTQLAAQPLRTLSGYISNAGTPAQVFVDAVNFSIQVQDKNGTMVYNFPDGTGISPDACGVTYNPPFAGAVPTTVCDKLAEIISVKDFGAVGDGITNDTGAVLNANSATVGQELFWVSSETNIENTILPSSDQKYTGLAKAEIFMSNVGDPAFEINGVEKVQINGLEITHNFDPTQHNINTPTSVQSQLIRCLVNSNDVVIENCTLRNTARQAIFASGSAQRWTVVGNYAKNLSREFWFSNQNAREHIIGLNHITNPGDDTFALNGDTRNSIVGLNTVNYDGANHTSGITGGGPIKIHGSYNVITGNTAKNVAAWWCQYFNGFDQNLNLTNPTGNLVIGNVVENSVLSPSASGTVGLYTCRPTTNGLNKSCNNILRGSPNIDGVVWRTTTNSSLATGGTYIFDGDVFENIRHGVFLSAGNGGRLMFVNCQFININANFILSISGVSNRTFEEVSFVNCEFGWAAGFLQDAIIRLGNINFTLNRLVLVNNRVVTQGGNIQKTVSLAGTSTVTTIILRDNEWTELNP